MNLINIPDCVSPKAKQALQWLINQSTSTSTGLADTLCTGAESEPELFGTDAALIDEAGDMADWANAFIHEMESPREEGGRRKVKIVYTSEHHPYESGDTVMVTSPHCPLDDPDKEYKVTAFNPPRCISDDQAGILFVEGRKKGLSAQYVTLVKGKL